MRGEQSAQKPDRDLEVLDVDVFVEREVRGDVPPGVVGFLLETEQDEAVERIDRRHQKRLPVPVFRRLGERLQVVVSPGVFFVAVPGVQKLAPHPRG